MDQSGILYGGLSNKASCDHVVRTNPEQSWIFQRPKLHAPKPPVVPLQMV